MRRLVSAAVHNSVAANLLMVVIIVVGGMSAYNLRRETFPQISFEVIGKRLPGAGRFHQPRWAIFVAWWCAGIVILRSTAVSFIM